MKNLLNEEDITKSANRKESRTFCAFKMTFLLKAFQGVKYENYFEFRWRGSVLVWLLLILRSIHTVCNAIGVRWSSLVMFDIKILKFHRDREEVSGGLEKMIPLKKYQLSQRKLFAGIFCLALNLLKLQSSNLKPP